MVKDTDKILQRKAVAIREPNSGENQDSGANTDPDVNKTVKRPIITAKGRGYSAERILDIAFAEGVKVRRDSDLTDMLDAFDEDSPVPLEALHAVGLILERVYQENRYKMDKMTTADAPDTNPKGA